MVISRVFLVAGNTAFGLGPMICPWGLPEYEANVRAAYGEDVGNNAQDGSKEPYKGLYSEDNWVKHRDPSLYFFSVVIVTSRQAWVSGQWVVDFIESVPKTARSTGRPKSLAK